MTVGTGEVVVPLQQVDDALRLLEVAVVGVGAERTRVEGGGDEQLQARQQRARECERGGDGDLTIGMRGPIVKHFLRRQLEVKDVLGLNLRVEILLYRAVATPNAVIDEEAGAQDCENGAEMARFEGTICTDYRESGLE